MGIGYILLFFIIFYLWAIPSWATFIASFYDIDILNKGSGNPGATNVFRECGKTAGVICFLLDFQKGFVPLFCFTYLMDFWGKNPLYILPYDLTCVSFLCLAPILGHIFTPYLNFKGGKGVATTAGCLCAFYPFFTFVFLFLILVFLFFANVTRYISLASVLTALMLPVVVFLIAVAFAQLNQEEFMKFDNLSREFYFLIKHFRGPL